MKRRFVLWLSLLMLICCLGNGFAESEIQVGDILFSNGAIVKADSLTAWKDDGFPIAVVAATYQDGTVLALGTQRSEEPLMWAPEGSAGETTRFSALESWIEGAQEGWAGQAVAFSGLLNGSGSWQAVCAEDAQGMKAADYPAFDFANTYATRFGLTGDAASGWYLPSIAEVCAIYQNREAINRSLAIIHSLDSTAAMDGLGTNWYWSSSQSKLRDDYAWFVHFFNGYVCDCPKSFTNLNALAVKRF